VIEEPFTAPFGFFSSFGSTTAGIGGIGSDFGGSGGFDAPDLATMGILSLLFGAGYIVASRRFDLSDKAGTATPFVAVGLVTLTASVVLLADDLHELGTAVLLLLIGAPLAIHGASVGRRATTWLGGAAVAIASVLIVTEIAPDDDATVTGLLLLVFGLAVVIGAHAAGMAMGEPDELEPGPSTYAANPTKTIRQAPPDLEL
jgi:hypothetical protein